MRDEKLEGLWDRRHGASGGADRLIQFGKSFDLSLENFLDPTIDVYLQSLVLLALSSDRKPYEFFLLLLLLRPLLVFFLRLGA